MGQHQRFPQMIRLGARAAHEEGLAKPFPDRVGLEPVNAVIAPVLEEMVAVLRVGEDVGDRDVDAPLLERQDVGRVEARCTRGEPYAWTGSVGRKATCARAFSCDDRVVVGLDLEICLELRQLEVREIALASGRPDPLRLVGEVDPECLEEDAQRASVRDR